MLVSVIIPTFNRSQYIEDAIESVLVQNYQDIEIIVIDDGSTDNTKEVLEPYIKKGLIKYYYQKNTGPSAARNAGIRKAMGNLIAFLDSDDLWLKNKLKKQVTVLNKNKKNGLVYTNWKSIDEHTNIVKNKFPLKHRLPSGKIFQKIVLGDAPLGTSTILVKRECFDQVGLYREDLFLHEDREMHARISVKYEIVGINEILCVVRSHSNNISKKLSIREKSGEEVIEIIFDNPLLKKNDLKFKKKALSKNKALIAVICLQNSKYNQAVKFILKSIYYNLFQIKSYKILARIFKVFVLNFMNI